MAIKKRSATVVPGASGAAAAVKNPQASKSSFWGELPQHVMSGISRMVPTLIMGGVILAFSQLIAYSWLKIPAEIGIMDALGNDSNLLIVFYVQIMPDDFVMQLHRF
ncbi:PTS system fructose-like transporter subunit IIC [Shigella sonnei]|nr:PTS system fructose-like transporter subunit IIC [Shigella sonnei]SJK63675.1 PTS system fructose-like transporter subunit IIC [Shigella sonnei]